MFRRSESPIGGEEDVDVGGLELPRVARQGLHQLLHCARLDEPHLNRVILIKVFLNGERYFEG